MVGDGEPRAPDRSLWIADTVEAQAGRTPPETTLGSRQRGLGWQQEGDLSSYLCCFAFREETAATAGHLSRCRQVGIVQGMAADKNQEGFDRNPTACRVTQQKRKEEHFIWTEASKGQVWRTCVEVRVERTRRCRLRAENYAFTRQAAPAENHPTRPARPPYPTSLHSPGPALSNARAGTCRRSG